MLKTARRQPRPRNRVPPSRSSFASARPVDAPEGTETVAAVPSSSVNVAATVGRPRLSKISQASTVLIFIMLLCSGQNLPPMPAPSPEDALLDEVQPLSVCGVHRLRGIQEATCPTFAQGDRRLCS